MRYAKEKSDKRDIFYTTERFDKLFVNFVDVELVCYRCKSTFPFKSLLHKHLKLNCVGQNQINTKTPTLAPVIQHVIKSTNGPKAVGSGYALKVWNYTTTIVCLTLGKILLYTDVISLCYLDTGCGVTLVDRVWLFDKALTKKILKMATLLKFKSIRTSRLNQTNLFLYLFIFLILTQHITRHMPICTENFT